jgi:hypothetical protein
MLCVKYLLTKNWVENWFFIGFPVIISILDKYSATI